MKEFLGGQHTLRMIQKEYTNTFKNIVRNTDWTVYFGSGHHPNDPAGYDTPYDFTSDVKRIDVRYLLSKVQKEYDPNDDYSEDYITESTWDFILDELKDSTGMDDIQYDWFS